MRCFARSALVLSLLVGVLVVATAAAASARTLALGDSVMKGATPQLEDRGYRVNARVSRQFAAGVEYIQDLARQDKLPKRVVVHLGNNGYVTMDQCRALIRATHGSRLWLVNIRVPRIWEADNNRKLARCARKSDRVELIDWHAHSAGHGDWFGDDGYHLTAVGARNYARYIDRFA